MLQVHSLAVPCVTLFLCQSPRELEEAALREEVSLLAQFLL